MNEILSRIRNVKKISSQPEIKEEDIEIIKKELEKKKIGMVARKYGFTSMPAFNSEFMGYVGCTPKEYKSNSFMKKRYSYEELIKFFSDISKIDPFVFYLAFSNHKFFGFLTRNEDYFTKLKNSINQEVTSLSISLHSLTVNRNNYMGCLYDILDKEAFFKNYALNLGGNNVPYKKLKTRYKSNSYEKEPINHIKTLLEEILDGHKA